MFKTMTSAHIESAPKASMEAGLYLSNIYTLSTEYLQNIYRVSTQYLHNYLFFTHLDIASTAPSARLDTPLASSVLARLYATEARAPVVSTPRAA